MPVNICDFLTKLATEPETLSSFILDPHKVMAKERLSKEVQEALTSGEAIQIHNQILASASKEGK